MLQEGYGIGLGKGKPFCASKIAKKKFGFSSVITGRGKSFGKISAITAAMSSYQKKHQRFTEFGRKRGPKAKMRGIFGVPGLGLQVSQMFHCHVYKYTAIISDNLDCSLIYIVSVFFIFW